MFNDAVLQTLRVVNSGMLPAFQLSPSSPIVQSWLSLATFGLLSRFIDFDEIAASGPRTERRVLIVGAANVSTGKLAKFVSSKEAIRLEHILASCAVPTSFRPSGSTTMPTEMACFPTTHPSKN